MANENIDKDTEALLREISDYDGSEFKGAYNIRVNCKKAERKSSEHIKIEDLELVKDMKTPDEWILNASPKHNKKWWCKVENGFILNLQGEKLNKIPYEYNS